MDKMKAKRILTFTALFIALTAFCVWVYWGNTSIQTTEIIISSEKIPEPFGGFTFVQVSDLHNAEFGHDQIRLLSAVKNASPDLIAVTGDLIDVNHTDTVKAMEFIYEAVEIASVYYITGNHEAWYDRYDELKQLMIEAGVIILDDDVTSIEHNGASVRLIGLSDPDFTGADSYEVKGMTDTKLKTLLSGISDNDEYIILLSHRPELFDVYAANNIDLVLSGHAHGGQVRLPFIGGIVAPDQGFFPKYTEGIHEKSMTSMVVSRGLGNSIIPVRINNRPELVVIKLEPY